MALQLEYRLLSGQGGQGELVNISSGGLFFRGGATLRRGDVVEVELPWPSAPGPGQPLRLCVHGLVVRSDITGTAMSISKYEFRGR